MGHRKKQGGQRARQDRRYKRSDYSRYGKKSYDRSDNSVHVEQAATVVVLNVSSRRRPPISTSALSKKGKKLPIKVVIPHQSPDCEPRRSTSMLQRRQAPMVPPMPMKPPSFSSSFSDSSSDSWSSGSSGSNTSEEYDILDDLDALLDPTAPAFFPTPCEDIDQEDEVAEISVVQKLSDEPTTTLKKPATRHFFLLLKTIEEDEPLLC